MYTPVQALCGVAQFVGHRPAGRGVTDSISGQGTGLVVDSDPGGDGYRGQPIDVSHISVSLHLFFPPSFSL